MLEVVVNGQVFRSSYSPPDKDAAIEAAVALLKESGVEISSSALTAVKTEDGKWIVTEKATYG